MRSALGLLSTPDVSAGGGDAFGALLAYSFTESGTSVTDRSGNGRHAEMLNGSTPTDLHSSGTFNTTGSARRLSYDAGSDSGARPASAASVSCKLTMGASVGSGNVWSRMRATDSSTFNLYIDSAHLNAVVRGSSGVAIINPGPTLSASTSYQAALTYDGTTVRLYLGGSLNTSNSGTSGNLDWSGSNMKWQAGDHEDDSVACTSFFIDDLRFFDFELTSTQVSNIASTPVAD